jgi:hypothetical protein
MCRHVGRTAEGWQAAYGYDRPLQTYFFQVFDSEDECVIDENCGHGRLLTLLEKTGVHVPEERRISYALDLPCCR